MTEETYSGKRNWRKLIGAFAIIIAVLTIDQIIKIWVKTHMSIGEEIPLLGNWFQLHYIENDGMGFGLLGGGGVKKLILSIFRIVAVIALFYFLFRLTKKNEKFSVIAGVALITAGAMGNIVDSVFYGKWLQGKVVDMFEFTVEISNFRVFPFIFNFADAAITVGVFYMILFQWKWLKTL